MAIFSDILGTGSSAFTIGSRLVSGVKQLIFRNANTGVLQWNPTASRAIDLPDASGTVALTTDVNNARRTISQITSTRNLAATDASRHLYNDSSSNYTLTIPASTFAASDEIEIARTGSGTLTITPGASVTINGASTSITVSQYKAVVLKFYSANVVVAYGAFS